jgi:type IV pilus assembly protein PilY1
MNSLASRLCAGLVMLGAAGTASAQQVAPPNIHFLIDTSGSMRELPQVTNSDHSEFFAITVNGCENPRLDAMQSSQGWNPAVTYPVADTGTGWGSDWGFPNLFQDSKFYGYLYWADLSNPTPQWNSAAEACQSQVPYWNTTGSTEYNRCQSCLTTKGYYKLPGAIGRNSPPLDNRDFIFWGRFLNFNPPKYVAVKSAIKHAIANVQNARVGFSYFSNSTPNTILGQRQQVACDQALANPFSFDTVRGGTINAVNGLAFITGTPLARSLLNIGYYFTSGNDVYQSYLGFGTSYAYPASFKNDALTSQSRSVCWGCQHNAVIIVSDGDPAGDSLPSGMVTRLRTINSGPVYCPSTAPCSTGSLATRDMGSDPVNYADDNPNFYLDDVAKVLSTWDLQMNSPAVVGDFDTSGYQRLSIHTVGYGINSNLLKNTAAVGNGTYATASTTAQLKQALQNAINQVQNQAASCVFLQ